MFARSLLVDEFKVDFIAATAELNTPEVSRLADKTIGFGTRVEAYSNAFALAHVDGIFAAAGLLLIKRGLEFVPELEVLFGVEKMGKDLAAVELGVVANVAALIREEND